MVNKYTSLRNYVCRYKHTPDFKVRMVARIFRWAKDESIEIGEFAFLTKKALNYLKK